MVGINEDQLQAEKSFADAGIEGDGVIGAIRRDGVITFFQFCPDGSLTPALFERAIVEGVERIWANGSHDKQAE